MKTPPPEVRCPYCYGSVEGQLAAFHPKCSRKMFDAPVPPIIPYRRRDLYKLAGQVVGRSVSVPGVQSKLSLELEKITGEAARLTVVGLWGNYILKPPTDAYPNIAEIEDMTMHLAAIFKLETVPHCLIKLKSGEWAYLTRRIDRVKAEQKLAMEDLCQLSGRLTEDKYKGSLEMTAKVIRKYSSHPLLDCLTFFEITLFSFLTGNADMHLKNFSLINVSPGAFTLAPAYDLLATRLLIPESKDSEESALTLNGKKRGIGPKDFAALGESAGLNTIQLKNTFDKFSILFPRALEFVTQGFLDAPTAAEYRSLLMSRAARLGLV